MDAKRDAGGSNNNNGLNFKEIIRASPCIFAIGVAGDSGSGKTTFTQSIREIFGEDLVTTITLDDYHLYDRAQRREMGVTPLDPVANRIDLIEEHLAELKAGRTIMKPVYDHAVGTFGAPVPFAPGKIVILEGLHTLFTPRLRELLDFTLFVEPDREVKEGWKIRRDMAKRGYDRDQVLKEILERQPDYLRYIAPQRGFADVVIRIGHSKYGSVLAQTRNVYQVSLLQDPIDQTIGDVDLGIDLFAILSLSERNFMLEFINHEDPRRRRGEVVFDGELGGHVVRRLEQSIEEQTHVRPIAITGGREYVTAVDVAQLDHRVADHPPPDLPRKVHRTQPGPGRSVTIIYMRDAPMGRDMSTASRIRESYNDSQERIVVYLRTALRKGKYYYKSKYIARDLGLSSKEVGTNMAILAEICEDLTIIRWSYSNSTTWMVTPKGA